MLSHATITKNGRRGKRFEGEVPEDRAPSQGGHRVPGMRSIQIHETGQEKGDPPGHGRARRPSGDGFFIVAVWAIGKKERRGGRWGGENSQTDTASGGNAPRPITVREYMQKKGKGGETEGEKEKKCSARASGKVQHLQRIL